MVIIEGRLKVSSWKDKEATYDELYSFGARSFSIWRADTLELVYDSGDQLGRKVAERRPDLFNNNAGTNERVNDTFDDRSDDKV